MCATLAILKEWTHFQTSKCFTMTVEPVEYRSIRTHKVLGIVLTVTFILLGYLISDWIFPSNSDNVYLLITIYLGLPLTIALVGVVIGSNAKGQIVYNSPNWYPEPVQLLPDEAAKIERRYLRKFVRLVPNGHFWLFYTPLLLLLGQLILPLYTLEFAPQYIPLVALLFSISLGALFVSALLLGMLATSNKASEDFKVPLIRESVWLARLQAKLPGVESTRVVLDKAEIGEFRIYQNPRIFIRLASLGDKAYIEVWTGELRAIDSILCRLHKSESTPQIAWWWVANDRLFRKFVDNDKEGYYVTYPVPSKIDEVGVRDVDLLTMNAISIIYREWLRTHGTDSAIIEILKQMNVNLSETND